MIYRKFLLLEVLMFTFMFTNLKAGNLEHARVKFWKRGTFHQETVDISKYEKGIIRAKVDGKWQEFKVRELPRKFIEWDIKIRTETLNEIRKGKMPSLEGPHNGMVATCGIRRLDTQFTINNAVKGMGFIPKKEKLKEIIKLLKSTINNPMLEKLDTLESLYKRASQIFDFTKQVSLELYSTPEFETQSFLNEMVNPAVSIVFLDIPSFEIKAIAQLLHPDDPELTDYEKDEVEYINLIHSYFHGEFKQKFIGVVYHIIEVYNNTPEKEGRGIRMVPSLP